MFAFVFLRVPSTAQVNVGSLSAKIGTIKTFFFDASTYKNYQYAVYPEIQIDGRFFADYLTWDAYWGYWNDGLEETFFVDSWTYSYSSHIVGARLSFSPQQAADHWLIPLDLFAGLAHHFIRARYVGGYDWYGKTGSDFAEGSSTAEIGLRAHINVVGPLAVVGEAQQFFPLGNSYFDQLQKGRRAYKIGVSLSI